MTTKPSGKKLILYTSGDPGSQAILQLLVDKGVRFERRDIRWRDPSGGLQNLKFLQYRNLDTVPQLFDDKEQLIGEFEAARLHLAKMKSPRAANAIA